MKSVYRSALGRTVDMDQLRLHNENVIAVGNMKVNARGDELGPGGEVVRTRNEIMNDYYNLSTPTVAINEQPVVSEAEVFPEPVVASKPGQLRGTLADMVAAKSKIEKDGEE